MTGTMTTSARTSAPTCSTTTITCGTERVRSATVGGSVPGDAVGSAAGPVVSGRPHFDQAESPQLHQKVIADAEGIRSSLLRVRLQFAPEHRPQLLHLRSDDGLAVRQPRVRGEVVLVVSLGRVE